MVPLLVMFESISERLLCGSRLVNLVREARLDAKIDSEANHVLMTPDKPDIYQQVIDKTKSLSFRSYVLAKQLEGRQQGQGGGGGGGNRGGNKGYQPAQ